jgi:hypothetical protein
MENPPTIFIMMTSQGPQTMKDEEFADHSMTTCRVFDNAAGCGSLPMSTGVPLLPAQSAHITARPTRACSFTHFVISSAGAEGGAADWVVCDIRIDGVSQFLKPGDIPGHLFSTRRDAFEALEKLVHFAPVQQGMSVSVIAMYTGTNNNGCPLFTAMCEG